jgi:citrate lyase gamma subunit
MNGLQSLMQGAPMPSQPNQAPAMPTQNDPRMAAAMQVVKDDVPEPLQGLVDESDFARKAMELLQSAGGQAAMNQPPAKPPTVKQRVDQQAAEGVAGLMARLAPGMQQRGRQVQQAQARQMLGGGMPTMGAPNMARMAMGGIVGYQAGGGVEEQPIMGPPEPNLYQRMGQGLKNYGANAQESMGILKAVKAGIGVPYEERSAVMKQVRDEIAAQNQNRDPNFIERMGQKLMNAGLNVEESKAILRKFYDTFGKTYEEMSNGMAMGGQVKGYAGPEGSRVSIGSAYIDPETGEPIPVSERIIRAISPIREGLAAVAKPVRMRELRGQYPEASEAELEAIYRERGLSAEYVYPSQRPAPEEVVVETETVAEATPAPTVGEVQRTGILDNLLGKPTADSNFRMRGVREPSAMPTPAAKPTTRERMGSSIDELLRIINEPRDTTRPEIDSRLEALRDPMIEAASTRMAPGYEESVRSRVQQEAAAAYALPQEYRDLIKARKKELETPLYTPEEVKSRKIDALLAGLASSNLIAQGGPRAAAGINAVTDAVKRDSLDRVNKSFELSAGLMDKDIAGAQAAFGEGLKAMNTAMNQASVATQMAGSMLNQADNAAAARALQDRQERLAQITSTISALGVIGQLERADMDVMVASQRAATTELSSIQRQLSTLLESLVNVPEENKPALQVQINTLQAQEKQALTAIQAARIALGLGTGGAAEGAGLGGGSGNITPEQRAADAILGI